MLRLMHRLTLLILLGLMALTAPAPAMADEMSDLQGKREAFAKDFAQTVITILHNPKESYDDRKNILRRAFADSVDTDWIAKFVLGRAWRNASEEQRAEYVKLYRKFLTETYVSSFAENPSKSIYSIKILGVNNENNEEFVARTQMLLMNKENLKVDYRVFEKDGKNKVRDIIIENVSLITTHRTEFTQLADTTGVDGVIKALQERIEHAKEVAVSMN